MEIGKNSPRAFFEYEKERAPDAKYFREILENSLTKEETRKFCEDFLHLFQFQGKSHKRKVTCEIYIKFSNSVINFKQIFSTKTCFFSPDLCRYHAW